MEPEKLVFRLLLGLNTVTLDMHVNLPTCPFSELSQRDRAWLLSSWRPPDPAQEQSVAVSLGASL